jgi:hypothetical protein
MHRFIFLLFFCQTAFAQHTWIPFSGKLTYSVQMADTALRKFYPSTEMSVITNDTLLRIENQTSFIGKQVLIKHLKLNKSYLLIESPLGNFAVQTNHSNDQNDSITNYTFQVFKKKKRIGGLKWQKITVTHKKAEKPFTCYVDMTKNPAYINTYFNLPGLPLHYYLPSEDGLLEYKLIRIEEYAPHKDAFGIPSDYKKVTFDEFLKLLFPEGGSSTIEPETPEKH